MAAPGTKVRDSDSRELALILAASRGDPTREAVRTLMEGPLDWERLTRLARERHATQGVWHVVSAYPHLPPEAAALQRLAVVNDFRRFHIGRLVIRVARALEPAGVRFAVLKGAALLIGGVRRPVQRTMSDIDILVLSGSPEDAWRACRADGWTLVDEAWDEALYRDHHHLPPLADPEGVNVGLEIHRALLPGIDLVGIDAAAFGARARTVRLDGVPVLVPSLEDLLLHDCLHFAWSNKLHRGAWHAFADAHAIVDDPAFDWGRFVALATSPRSRRCCYWALRLGRVVADLPVPAEVLRSLDPHAGGRLATLLERHFTRQILEPSAEFALSEQARRWLWLRALGERGAFAPGSNPWTVGAVDLPGEGDSASRPPRSRTRVALSTVRYVARLFTGA